MLLLQNSKAYSSIFDLFRMLEMVNCLKWPIVDMFRMLEMVNFLKWAIVDIFRMLEMVRTTKRALTFSCQLRFKRSSVPLFLISQNEREPI